MDAAAFFVRVDGQKAERPSSERVPLQVASTVNEVWSMDFVSDSLANGRRLKYLTVADDFSHQSVEIAVDYGSSAQFVTRLLEGAARFRGCPLAVRTDNGPECTSRGFMAWAQSHGIRHILIQPGRLIQNGYIDSLNGEFRDEHLNEQWFESLDEARRAAVAWRQDYNQIRPHNSLGRIPPAQFAEQHRQRAGDAAQCLMNKELDEPSTWTSLILIGSPEGGRSVSSARLSRLLGGYR